MAIGYFIVLAFVTSYRKITGKKSREEKESEAAKRIRIVLGHDLLDTAFTKPEELPGQKPKFIRPLPRYGSVNDSALSSDGDESESETQSEDESVEDERNLMENRSEKEDLHKKVEVCLEVPQQPRSQALDVTNDVTDSDVINQDGSRTTSASSGHYSTASEMVESDGRDSRGNDIPVLNTGTYDTPGENTQEYDTQPPKTLEQNTPCGHETVDKSIPDVAKLTINESGFFEESTPDVHSMKPVSSLQFTKTAPVIHSNILDSGLLTDKAAPAKHSRILDSGIETVKTATAIHSANQDSDPAKITAIKHDCSPRTTTFSHHIEISPSLGKLKYSVHYMREKNELQVTIIKAINLFHEKNETLPSCFVKVSLLPQRFCWQKTKIIEETRHPVFNETFVISGFSHERFSNYTLLISVVNAVAPWQGFYGDHVIGELYVPLCHVAKYSCNQERVFSQWTELKPKISEVGTSSLTCSQLSSNILRINI